jgi:hypothetical protein
MPYNIGAKRRSAITDNGSVSNYQNLELKIRQSCILEPPRASTPHRLSSEWIIICYCKIEIVEKETLHPGSSPQETRVLELLIGRRPYPVNNPRPPKVVNHGYIRKPSWRKRGPSSERPTVKWIQWPSHAWYDQEKSPHTSG